MTNLNKNIEHKICKCGEDNFVETIKLKSYTLQKLIDIVNNPPVEIPEIKEEWRDFYKIDDEKWKKYLYAEIEKEGYDIEKRNSKYLKINSIEISNLGNVRIDKKDCNICTDIDGYSYIKNYYQLTKYFGHVHRMVAKTWLDSNVVNEKCKNCYKKENCIENLRIQVHHIYNDEKNCIENLIWINKCDHSKIPSIRSK